MEVDNNDKAENWSDEQIWLEFTIRLDDNNGFTDHSAETGILPATKNKGWESKAFPPFVYTKL